MPEKITITEADPQPVSAAHFCLLEPELDEWWNGLDVEDKASVFVEYSLHAQGQGEPQASHGVPFLGTVVAEAD